VRDQAVVERHDVVAGGPPQPGPSVGDCEPEGGAEAPRVERGAGAHDRLLPAPVAPQRVGDEVDLRVHLRRVPEGGEIAPAAAVGHVRAPGLDPVGRGLDDPHDRAAIGAVTAVDRHLDHLAGQGAVDQHDPTVVPSRQRRAACHQPLGPHEIRHPREARATHR
jgi:hypothetical protein